MKRFLNWLLGPDPMDVYEATMAAFRAEWDEYQKWNKAQPCVDCGKLKNGKDIWLTEIQCWDCFEKNGCTERRGNGSAIDMADERGVLIR